MKIALEPFARRCIESSFGEDLPAGTQAALRHYARRLRSRRQPAPLPPFGGAPRAAPEVEFELTVPAELEGALTAEARRREVSIERIVAHAVFVYFADLDVAAAAGTEGQAKEGPGGPRYRFHARPQLQATVAGRHAVRAPRGRGCDGARAGRDPGPG